MSATGEVTYTYSTTLSQPLEHAAGALENAITLTGVTVQVTDKDTDTTQGSFNVTIVDDVPQAVADTAAAAEDTAVTYNVITNANGTSDLQGADAPATLTAATLATAGAGTVGLPGERRHHLYAAAGFCGRCGHQLHDHRPGRRHLVLDADGDGCGGFCAERGVDDQPDG